MDSIMDDQTHMMSGPIGLSGISRADMAELEAARKHEYQGQSRNIGDILQQIMAITDESLDEAQAR